MVKHYVAFAPAVRNPCIPKNLNFQGRGGETSKRNLWGGQGKKILRAFSEKGKVPKGPPPTLSMKR